MMNIGELVHDKKLMLGVGGAAAVGGVVLVIRSRKGAGSPAAGAAASGATGGTTLQPSTYDSTGTDIYNGLQSISQGWTDQFTDLGAQLTDVQNKLNKLPATPAATTPAAHVGLLDRKFAGTTTIPIKSNVGTGSGRWTWAQLVPQFFNTTGATPAQVSAAAAKLRAANPAGLKKWDTVKVGQNIFVPAHL